MRLSSNHSFSQRNGQPYLDLIVGTPISFDFAAQSDVPNTQIDLVATGEPFELAQNKATFQIMATSYNSLNGTFTWAPNISQIRTKPYVINIRGSDRDFAYDFTVVLNVYSSIGLDESALLSNDMNLYPNPSNGNVKLSLKQVPKSECTVEILNLQGQKIQEIQIDRNTLIKGAELNIDAAPGTYIIRLKGEEVESKVFVIQ